MTKGSITLEIILYLSRKIIIYSNASIPLNYSKSDSTITRYFLNRNDEIAINFRRIHAYVKAIENVGRPLARSLTPGQVPRENIAGRNATITSRTIIPVRSNERASKKGETPI